MRAYALGLLVIGLGCSEEGKADSSSTTGEPATTTDVIGSDTTTTPVADDTSTGVLDDDTGPPPGGGECILWGDNCSDPNQKCMPWSLENDSLPDETRCCALQDNPDLVGESCTVEDYDGSCLDSCEEGAMCVVDNADTLLGLCRQFCDAANESSCPDSQTCKAFFELLPGVLNVPMCMDKCDPLVQDCTPTPWHCIPDSPTPAGQSGFICVPPPPGEEKPIFDDCALANQCEKGLVCLPPSRVPDCNGLGCCTAYCSLADGDAACQSLHPDMVCVDWMSPDPDWSDVGACALPD